MQEKATEFLQGVLAIAREEQLMSEGRLMSAAQVAEALSASTPWNPLLAGWFLCGDIHPELFERLKTGLQAQPLGLLVVSCGKSPDNPPLRSPQ